MPRSLSPWRERVGYEVPSREILVPGCVSLMTSDRRRGLMQVMAALSIVEALEALEGQSQGIQEG